MSRALQVLAVVVCSVVVLSVASIHAQSIAAPPAADAASQPPVTIACASTPGGPQTHWPADTSAGVVLVNSTGTAACLLGKTWGYDQSSIWVSEGCVGEFRTGQSAQATASTTTSAPKHVPNLGFLIFDGEKGQIYMRL